MGSQSECELPIIDFTKEDMKPGSDSWVSACKTVRSALEDHGAFLALYDKVGSELYESVFSSINDLFDLPLETKKRETTKRPFYSYAGQYTTIPLYESVAIDSAVSVEHCQNYTRTMWPQGNDPFCESVNLYAKKVAELDKMVKRMVFESYGVKSEKCENFLASSIYVLRSYKYRPPEVGEDNLGVATHTDTTILTILNQKSHGLEIKLKDGEWVQIDASPSLFLVLAGDAFVVWSNDRIRGCVHRVMMNSTVNRYSMGLLSYADKIFEPQEELVDAQHPLRYQPFDHYGYLSFTSPGKVFTSGCRRLKAYCGI